MALVNPSNKNNQEFNPNVDNSAIQANASSTGKVITYLSFILIIPIFIYIGTRNKLVKLQMKINEASSGIDVQLKKRRDTLVKMVDATKSSVKFEKSILTDITKLRSSKGSSGEQLQKGDTIMSKLNATFEAYPDLKSTAAFQKLMTASEDIEQEIAATRRLYNAYVNSFNTSLFTWPGSVIATGMKLSKLPLFAASEADKKDVSLNI